MEKRRVLEAWGAVCADAHESLQARGAASSLKVLSVVVKNVVAKGAGAEGAKYRTLKLSNPKVAAAIGAQPAAMAMLAGLGFVEAGGELVLGADFDAPLLSFALQQLLAAAAAAATTATATAAAAGGAPAMPARAGLAVAPAQPSAAELAKMSMKQKARLDAERREKRARADEAAERKLLLQRLEMDKKARKVEGWSATGGGGGVDKSGGKAIGTFRERFGEDQGG